MRSTASLAAVVMKIWNEAWKKMMKNEELILDLMLRYVDDCRAFLPSSNEGRYWNDDGGFEFSWKKRKEDLESSMTDEQRTITELTNLCVS